MTPFIPPLGTSWKLLMDARGRKEILTITMSPMIPPLQIMFALLLEFHIVWRGGRGLEKLAFDPTAERVRVSSSSPLWKQTETNISFASNFCWWRLQSADNNSCFTVWELVFSKSDKCQIKVSRLLHSSSVEGGHCYCCCCSTSIIISFRRVPLH